MSEETIERVEEEEERDYHVVLEGAWSVKDVDTVDDAVNVAVSEAGKSLTGAGLDYVDVEVGATLCPACGEPFESAFSAAGTALVGIILELDVFNATSEEHAGRIAKSTVGKALTGVPLEVVEALPKEQG